jgi:putative nucleotidyltransferase with HDIG domain
MSTTPESVGAPVTDILALLRGFVSLRRLATMYPAGHPVIGQKLDELHQITQTHLQQHPALTIDVIRGIVHLDGTPLRDEATATATSQAIRELATLGIDSLHLNAGVERGEILLAAQFLSEASDRSSGVPLDARLAGRGIRHVSFGRIVPLDTRWRGRQWPDSPQGALDPAYAQSLDAAEEAFETVAAGGTLNAVTVRDLVQLLIGEVVRSNAALGQILTLKEYENLTYCHSVNVAILSLLIARQLTLDEVSTFALVEAALLHDIGKTKIPLEILKKPGALDRTERRLINAHTTFGAEILFETPGLHPLAPIVALEHHRGLNGTGYPDLGEGEVPHIMSQIVSIADAFEAMTGARTYREPMRPEQACLVLARLSGTNLNAALVKAFVAAVTFFPVGTLVRTSRDETGVVIRTNSTDPLHPVLGLLSADFTGLIGEVDTAVRDADGSYERQIAATLSAKEHGVDLTALLRPSEPTRSAS